VTVELPVIDRRASWRDRDVTGDVDYGAGFLDVVNVV